jgi:hypothetical protein
MKWRYAMMPVALAGLAIIPLQGCGAEDLQKDLCCSEFTPGADLATVEWGLQGEAEANYGAFMQAVSDFTGVANAMVSDVTNACQAIAVDLGADPSEVTDRTPEGRATAWCAIAKAKIAPAASLKISFQPPSCRVNASLQASCEGKCSGSASCEITPGEIVARCDPGKLSVKCGGSCTAKCEGSANLAVSCDGACEGTCEGACSGECDGMNNNANCRGACTGGTCNGMCRGSCTMSGSAKVQCEGQCTGGCDGDFTAPKCTAELSPPKAECNANVDCNASCKASASAKAECTEGSVTIDADSNLADIIATLQVNLPKLILVAKARGDAFVANAQAIATLGGSLEVTGSVKAGACIIPAGAAMAQAAKSAGASVTASVDVLASVNIK